MFYKRELGRRGEDTAVNYLKRRGLKVIERNFRCRLGEIDVVAREGDLYIFVEVRSINEGDFIADPLETIGQFKRERLRRLALLWLVLKGASEHRARFDIIAITFKDGSKRFILKHLTNAF